MFDSKERMMEYLAPHSQKQLKFPFELKALYALTDNFMLIINKKSNKFCFIIKRKTATKRSETHKFRLDRKKKSDRKLRMKMT